MRKFYLFTLLVGLTLFLSSNYTNSQTVNDTSKVSSATAADSLKLTSSAADTANITGEIGKIFTKAEADSLFGPVLKVDTLKTEILAKLAAKTPKYMMFNLIDGKACVLDASRTSISDTTQIFKPEQVFRLLSTSKVLELIKAGGSVVTTVETRANVLTITNGSTVLEETTPCPPLCR